MGSVRVAIVGVGNCAASLVQGVQYYADADPNGNVPGLMHVDVRRLPRQRRRVRRRVRRRRQEGRLRPLRGDRAPARTTRSSSPTCRRSASPCSAAYTHDGLGKYYRETIEESDAEPVDIVAALREAQADVLVSYLPVGSENADKFYAQCAIDAGVAFVNALPVFIACDPEWAAKFEAAGVPIIGDDIKSQVGATITHRVLAKLFEDRGVRARPHLPAQRRRQHGLQEHARARPAGVQEDLQDPGRHVEHRATTSAPRNVHIGPSDYVAVARRPQVGLRPARGPRVRRRAAEHGVQARGLGLPELGRHHHRRHPGGQDRQGPRHRRRAALRLVVPDEVPAGADAGRPRPGQPRGVHPRRASSADLAESGADDSLQIDDTPPPGPPGGGVSRVSVRTASASRRLPVPRPSLRA